MFQIAGDNFIDAVDGNTQVMQAYFHARLTQPRIVAKQGEIEAPVCQRHIAFRRATQFLEAEISDIEISQGIWFPA